MSQRIGERPWGHLAYQPCNTTFNTIINSLVKRKDKAIKTKTDTWHLQMSACLCTHGYHDEILNFTGVQRTKIEINVHLFDSANDYTMKKTTITLLKCKCDKQNTFQVLSLPHSERDQRVEVRGNFNSRAPMTYFMTSSFVKITFSLICNVLVCFFR